MPNTVPSTTLAVLRPTPGSCTRLSKSRGISPWWRSTTARAIPSKERALLLKNPVLRITSISGSGSACASAAASGQRRNSSGVT